MQQDLLTPTQTPREAILFSAMLRLPAEVPLAEKVELVEKMLDELGLMDCADTLIGDEMIRGISGGEKKRTSIGIELVRYPDPEPQGEGLTPPLPLPLPHPSPDGSPRR